MKLWRRILLIVLAVLLLVPTGGLYLVASTESGLRFIAARLGKIGKVTVTATGVSGTLTGGFKVKALRIEERHADVSITDAEGRLQLLPLLVQRHIELSSVSAQQVTVQLHRPDGERSGRTPHFMPATMSVAAEAAHAQSVDLILSSGRTLHATNGTAGVQVTPDTVRITNGQIDWQDLHLAADGRVHATDPIGIDGHVAGDWRPAGKPGWLFESTFDGDLDRLPLTVDINKPFHAHVQGAATSLHEGWKFTGNGKTQDLDISVFGGGTALGILSADVALSVDADGFSANGPVTAPGLKAGPVQVDFHGAYSQQRLTIRNTTLLHKPSGSRGTVHGTVDVLPEGPRLNLAGEWTTFQWPLAAAEPAFRSTGGKYTIAGTKPWTVTATGAVSAAGIADMPGEVAGSLGTETFDIEKGSLGLFGGMASATGTVRWHPAESWSVSGHMFGLDAAQLRADLSGRLNFDFNASGAPFGAAGGIDFALSHLSGKLRNQAATGSGRFTKAADSPDWQFHDVDLQLGRTHIQLDGSLGEQHDIRFALDADDLSLLDPEAHGRISARGRYAGTNAAPVLLFKARGTDFGWQGISLDTLDADVDLDLRSEGHAQGKVDLAGIQYGNRTVQHAVLNVSGSGTDQHLALTLDAAPLRATLTAQGTLQDARWRGNVESVTIDDDADLALHLREPAPLSLDRALIELGNLCLAGDQANGCLSAQRHADGRWSSVFSAQQMPLRAFTAGLTQDMDYDGTISMQGELAGSAQNLPTGSIRADLMGAQLRHLIGKQTEVLSLGSGRVQATASASTFSADVTLDAGASGEIRGQLTGERSASEWRDYPIRGRVDARTDSLALLDMYVGGIDKATGLLTTSVDISGKLGDPVIAGQLVLKNASIDVYQSGTALRDVSLDARFDRQALDISGQSKLGGGMAQFSGRLSWRDNEPYGSLHVKGEKLRVVNVPEARIDASPDLDFELSGRRIKATGEVQIPWARLQPTDLTGVVLASDDEHIVGTVEVSPDQRWIVTSNIMLALGNDVNIDSLGLTASLGGRLTVTLDEAGTTRGNGELNVRTGGNLKPRYSRFGRLLDIERGRLLYKDGPLGNPGLELRAQKEYPDVTAGMNVRGTLRNPKVTFFSDPPLSQLQIASILFAGGSLDSAQSSAPGAARNELLTQIGGLAAQPLLNRVGIDDIGVESDFNSSSATGASTTSLVLGKYLSPRVYVSYGISLAEAINTFKLRVSLWKGWTVKTESGKARSADIVYTITKGAKDKDKDKPKAPDTPKQ